MSRTTTTTTTTTTATTTPSSSPVPATTSVVWPLGVCVFPDAEPNRARTVSYGTYVHEILEHAGVCHTRVEPADVIARLPQVRILLTVGEHAFPVEARHTLQAWVEGGGAWISIGGTCGMSDVLGVSDARPAYSGWGAGVATLGEGYLVPREGTKHPAVAHVEKPLHFFGGGVMQTTGAAILADALDAHARPTRRPIVFEHRLGRGRCVTIAVDITGTIVRIQQGVGVTRDGVSAPDATASVADGVLKSGDGGVLDWLLDRDPIPGVGELQAFLRPIADLWRELLLHSIFHLATEHGVPLSVLWFYPRNLPAVAHLSHDTDGNDPAKGRLLLEALRKAGIKSTWCTILPGYDQDLTRSIRDAGHELAMHYDAMTPGLAWGEREFDRQWRELVKLFDGERPVSNKNHYLRWEGDVELLEWCARRGIRIDQSKGASKTGEAGYNFGTCHPYFCVSFAGRRLNVLQLPTVTQDLEVFAPRALLAPLLNATIKHYGVLHLLFHPAHIDKASVEHALLHAAASAKTRGLEWWTAKQLDEWERARRGVRWKPMPDGGMAIASAAPLHDATILSLGADEGGGGVGEPVTRWGFPFRAKTINIEKGATVTVRPATHEGGVVTHQ